MPQGGVLKSLLEESRESLFNDLPELQDPDAPNWAKSVCKKIAETRDFRVFLNKSIDRLKLDLEATIIVKKPEVSPQRQA